jgi:hypothetical protein
MLLVIASAVILLFEIGSFCRCAYSIKVDEHVIQAKTLVSSKSINFADISNVRRIFISFGKGRALYGLQLTSNNNQSIRLSLELASSKDRRKLSPILIQSLSESDVDMSEKAQTLLTFWTD